ncbi:tetratricopeptide repeat protein [Desulfosporosinus sp. Sb-LF]|uniref:tetratricopeptide repeat protein n=1 Tax=Desulfosporosinus sp. Sb-LF TaxID=2560027 RepID=UPI00107F3678|nr:tetratricopeptide repeat protein [Desulfosporosinus sp. Sb-LF]TGE34445.1 tetratricopeptide repeat protein [Desulfosporosinus sp. Sb-LF]
MIDNNLVVNAAVGKVKVPQPQSPKSKKDSFTPLTSAVLILLTLVISVGGWYGVGKYFFWSDLDMKRVNQQLEFYKQKVQTDPNNTQARVDLGHTYFLKGNDGQAIQEFNQALIIDPKDFDAYYNLSLVLIKEKRFNEALEKLNKAGELSPRDYKVPFQKGIVYRNLKMYKEATDSLNMANTLMPTNTDIIFEIGMVAEAQGQKDNAIQIYKQVLSYDPLYKPAIAALERLK